MDVKSTQAARKNTGEAVAGVKGGKLNNQELHVCVLDGADDEGLSSRAEREMARVPHTYILLRSTSTRSNRRQTSRNKIFSPTHVASIKQLRHQRLQVTEELRHKCCSLACGVCLVVLLSRHMRRLITHCDRSGHEKNIAAALSPAANYLRRRVYALVRASGTRP